MRWGALPPDTDAPALVAAVNREDIWRTAATMAGVPAAEQPNGTSRGVERFFDGHEFDPANPADYLAKLAIKKASAA